MAAEQGHPSKAAVEGGDSVDPVERGHSRPGPAMERITIPRELVADFEAFLARHGWELRRGQTGLKAQRVAERRACLRHHCLLTVDGRCLSCEAAGG